MSKITLSDIIFKRELIDVSYLDRYKDVPDTDWEYVSPSGEIHKWEGNNIPTLGIRKKPVPRYDYVFNGEDEIPIQNGFTYVEYFYDPETNQEVIPRYKKERILSPTYVPGVINISCYFYTKDMSDFEKVIPFSDCSLFVKEEFREYIEKELKESTVYITEYTGNGFNWSGTATIIKGSL